MFVYDVVLLGVVTVRDLCILSIYCFTNSEFNDIDSSSIFCFVNLPFYK